MKAVLGLAAVFAPMAGAALAQGIPERRMDISLSGRAVYDSNTLRGGDFLFADEEDRAEDVRFTPSAVVDIVFPVSRQALFLNGSVGYDFYLRNSRLNSERIGLTGGADLQIGASCTSRIAADYSRRRSDIADIIQFERVTNTEEARGIGVQGNCGASTGLRAGLGYRHQTVQNSELALQRNNYQSDTIDADIAYVRPTFGSLALFATHSITEYEDRFDAGPAPLPPVFGSDGVKFYSYGLRFSRDIGSRLKGTVSVGRTKADPDSPQTPDFSGLSYSASVAYRPNERLGLNLTAARQANVSNTLASDYSITTSYGLAGDYALSRRLRLTFGTSYEKRDIRQDPDLPVVLLRDGDKTYQGYVGADFQLNDRLSLDAQFLQERRDSDNPRFGYKSTRISAGVRLNI